MIDLKKNNILVTGGYGFIGSHLIEHLVKLGCKSIVCTYRANNPRSYFNSLSLLDKVISANCDLKDYARVADVISKYEINLIFHLGAQPIVGTAFNNPLETITTNVIGTANILEAARIMGGKNIRGIVVASSDKAYGVSENLPYKETYPLAGSHPYDVSKSAADLIAQSYFKTYAMPINIGRFGNVYGAGDLNFNRIIPGIFKSIIEKTQFQIRSDGKMIREYVYAPDVADGYIKMAENIDKTVGEAFNFGSNDVFDVLEILANIEKALNIKIDYKVLDIAKNEIPKQYLDWTKAKEILKWEPKSDFQNKIKQSFEWYKKYLSD